MYLACLETSHDMTDVTQGCQTHFGVGPHWMKCDFMGAGAMQPVAGCKHAHTTCLYVEQNSSNQQIAIKGVRRNGTRFTLATAFSSIILVA